MLETALDNYIFCEKVANEKLPKGQLATNF